MSDTKFLGDVDSADAPLEDVDLLTEIVKAMVELPEAVRVHEKRTAGSNESTLWIDVAPADRGKVIGKQGRTITSIRNIFCSIGALEGKKLLVMVAEPGKNFTHPPRQNKRDHKVISTPEVSRVRTSFKDTEGHQSVEMVDKKNG